MLRSIVITLSRNLKISAFHQPVRYLAITPKCLLIENVSQDPTPLGTNYSKPYVRPVLHSRIFLTKDAAIEELCQKMQFGKYEAERIFKEEPKLKKIKAPYFTQVINRILNNEIDRDSVAENAWILAMNPDNLINKLETIKELRAKNINDMVPLLRISHMRLKKIVSIYEHDSKQIKGDCNRIYYLSQKLNLEPKIISKYVSTRLFMLEMPWQMFLENLNIMIEYNVAPKNIINDLWAFRYAPKNIRARFERARTAQKEKIMPWMVRCPETILQRSLHLTLEEKELLGDHNTLTDYVAERLGFTVEVTQAILQKHPAVFKVRVTKIKEILDYLLDEAGFTKYDIGQTPRILCHGLDTTKKRLDELKSIGCRPSSLIIVCKSRREYEKFINSWLASKNKIRDTCSSS